MAIFEGFALEHERLDDDVTIRVRHGGTGPAVVLLHGHPRTHTTWHQVAPQLVEAGLTAVCPDLRGYGRSVGPDPDPGHHAYSDRAMAGDIVRLMTHLGHDRFAVVRHDRGSYVAYRTALDHPERVLRLAVLDSVPIVEALERADARFAEAWWHWFFFVSDQAERVITADPMAWYRLDRSAMGREGPRRRSRRPAQPTRRPGHARGLPRRAARRPRGRRGRPGGGPPDRLTGARRLVESRRHGAPLRRPGRGLATLVPARPGVWGDHVGAPHGRGEPRPADHLLSGFLRATAARETDNPLTNVRERLIQA